MTKRTIEVDVPDGYVLKHHSDTPGLKLIFDLEKIKLRRIVLEETGEIRREFFEINGRIQQSDSRITAGEYKIWHEVKETDIPLTNDETKLSLSLAECNNIVKLMDEGCMKKTLLRKIRKFIKENS